MKHKKIRKYNNSTKTEMHIKLQNLSLPDNEVYDMVKRYRFDIDSTQKMLNDAIRSTEEYNMLKELKEYEEKNYDAICYRLSELSTLELIKRLVKNILHYI